MRAAEPNPGHQAIVGLERLFSSCVVVTQNIDGLHQKAGSKNVLELHGGLRWARCNRCGERMTMDDALDVVASPPPCPCGGLFRPDVVWFGEMLPPGLLERAVEAAEACGVFLTVGTSGTVMPAAALVRQAAQAGAVVVEVNPEPSAMAGFAHIQLDGKASITLPWLIAKLEAHAKRRRR
jgi:NAD-dependent deacetylase